MTAVRFLCLLFPRLGVQVALQSRPELGGRPTVLISGRGAAALVSAASTEAAARGVVPGMTPAQARARCTNATFLPDNAGDCLEELERISSILRTRATTPVAIISREELLLDLDNLPRHLGTDEAQVAARVTNLVRMWTGLSVRAGVGSTRAEVREAARGARLRPAVRPPVLAWDEAPVVPAPADPVAAEVPVPSGTPPLAVRARVHRAAARMQTILVAREQSFRELRLTLSRADGRVESVRRLLQPSADVTASLVELGAWLTDDRLHDAAMVRLEVARLGPDVAVEPAVAVQQSWSRRDVALRAAG